MHKHGPLKFFTVVCTWGLLYPMCGSARFVPLLPCFCGDLRDSMTWNGAVGHTIQWLSYKGRQRNKKGPFSDFLMNIFYTHN